MFMFTNKDLQDLRWGSLWIIRMARFCVLKIVSLQLEAPQKIIPYFTRDSNCARYTFFNTVLLTFSLNILNIKYILFNLLFNSTMCVLHLNDLLMCTLRNVQTRTVVLTGTHYEYLFESIRISASTCVRCISNSPLPSYENGRAKNKIF